jgi:hypothetical protein
MRMGRCFYNNKNPNNYIKLQNARFQHVRFQHTHFVTAATTDDDDDHQPAAGNKEL